MMGKGFENAMQFNAAVSRPQYFQTLNADFSKLVKGVPRTDFREGQNEKKISGGQNPIFFAQKYQIFGKIDLFFRNICPSGEQLPPLPLLGYALGPY